MLFRSLSAEAVKSLTATEFLGYGELSSTGARVIGILVDGQLVDSLAEGERAVVVLDRTPFYAESGGQVGDTGMLEGDGLEFRVKDTVKLAGSFHGHVGKLQQGCGSQEGFSPGEPHSRVCWSCSCSRSGDVQHRESYRWR